MAVLGGRRRPREPGDGWTRLFGTLALLFLVGCVLYETVVGEDEPGFSHRQHVTELGMDCSVCHKREPGAVELSLPPEQLCQLCHRRIDADKPYEQTAASYFVDGEFQSENVLALEPYVVFQHVGHIGWVDDCSACHRGIAQNERITADDRLDMADCMACHEQRDVPNDCASCHPDITTEWAPRSHEHAWTVLHGEVFRNPDGTPADDCSLCHTDTSCVMCHQEQQPADHTNFFRLRSHGLDASFDRRRCQACHRDDFCNRCHQDVLPLSHTGNFGSPRNTHCLSCHFPLRNETCFVCHKNTASHGQAAPLPPGHSPTWNCRQCHGAGIPLPHVDDGSDCTLCHK